MMLTGLPAAKPAIRLCGGGRGSWRYGVQVGAAAVEQFPVSGAPGQLHVRLVRAGEPGLTQPRVGRFLSSPQRVDVGMIGGEAGRHLGTPGNGPVAGD